MKKLLMLVLTMVAIQGLAAVTRAGFKTHLKSCAIDTSAGAMANCEKFCKSDPWYQKYESTCKFAPDRRDYEFTCNCIVSQ